MDLKKNKNKQNVHKCERGYSLEFTWAEPLYAGAYMSKILQQKFKTIMD